MPCVCFDTGRQAPGARGKWSGSAEVQESRWGCADVAEGRLTGMLTPEAERGDAALGVQPLEA